MRLIPVSLLAAVCLLAAPPTLAQPGPNPTGDPTGDQAADQRPLVAVDVSLEMAAIERSLAEISTAVGEMAAAMEQIATSGELTPGQQEHLDNIMANLDEVTAASRRSVDALPGVVERSKTVARQGAEQLLSDLKLWFFVIVGVVAVLLVVALAAFYWFTLRPLQNTVLKAVSHISDMAQAMANTSKSLEIINQTHREVLRLSGASDDPPAPPG